MIQKHMSHNAAQAIVDLGRNWYRGRPPRVFFIEDIPETCKAFQLRFWSVVKRIPFATKTDCQLATSVDDARKKLESGLVTDVIILDHQLPKSNNDNTWASPEETEDLLLCINHVVAGNWNFLVRISAHLSDALDLSHTSCLIQKDSDKWMDIVLAYVFRTMTLITLNELRAQFRTFDFDLLHGWIPASRVRGKELEGMDEFDKFNETLELWWPMLAGWPEDEVGTREQIEPLLSEVRKHFHVDESKLDLEAGDGAIRLKLLYCPESSPPSSVPQEGGGQL